MKRKRIDTLGLGYHLLLLCLPLSLFVGIFYLFSPTGGMPWMILSLVSMVYIIGYSLSYYLHQGRLVRLWQHLEQVVNINDTTFELVHLASQYKDEHAFLDALLNKAVNVINGAEMGCIIRVDPESHKLTFESSVGIDLQKLRSIDFTLEQSFEYRLTDGRCDRVVVVDDMRHINEGSTLSKDEQQTLLTAPKHPIRSTLSSPIHIDGKLYAMLNLDSSQLGAFSDYDRNLVAILTHEAASAISLYQKSREIRRLANFDALTGLFNRRHFEESLGGWKHSRSVGSFLVLIDMDNLKAINDRHGHQAGDVALARLGQALGQLWPGNALVARFGGDEFVVLSHGPQERIKEALDELQIRLEQSAEPIGFSYGLAPYIRDWEASFSEADKAMYEHKRWRKQSRANPQPL
nr:sensor domain-containing diguanylate cyclase [Shewanella jiangmenensis]